MVLSLLTLTGGLVLPIVVNKENQIRYANTNITLIKKGLVASLEQNMIPNDIFTSISINFPFEMFLNETRYICIKVNRIEVDYSSAFSIPNYELPLQPCKTQHYAKENFDKQDIDTSIGTKDLLTKKLKMIDSVRIVNSDINISLISTGFDIQGKEKAKAGDSFPLFFKWVITPKNVGIHDLLIDLSEIFDEVQSDLAGFASSPMVWIRNQPAKLTDGYIQPITIIVSPNGFAKFDKWWPIIVAVFAFIAYLLNHVLVIEYLRKKFNLPDSTA